MPKDPKEGMSPTLRKRNTKTSKVDEVALESHDLAKAVNVNDPDAVIDYIQYFGDISNVFKGRVVGVDSSGIDCLYTVAGNPMRKELRIQFDSPVETVEEAKEKLKSMAKEAHRILHHDIDKSYQSPNTPKPVDWSWPTLRTFFIVSIIWTVTLLGIHLDDEQMPHSILVNARHKAGGIPIFERVLTALLIMHSIEVTVAVGMCIYARVPFETMLKWIPTVFVFGIPSLQDCMKVCVRYAMYRDPVTFGVPENVLNGHYMKYRRILTDADLGLLPVEGESSSK